eukprot:scaffold83874_cov50-Phaeocystis_antarctica.AAC.1
MAWNWARLTTPSPLRSSASKQMSRLAWVGLGVGLGRGLDVEARRDGGRQRGAPGDPGRACVIRVAAARARLLLQHLRELVPADEAGLVRVRVGVRVRVRVRVSELVPADEAGLVRVRVRVRVRVSELVPADEAGLVDVELLE